jgi:AraC-like DNA-binding protein
MRHMSSEKQYHAEAILPRFPVIRIRGRLYVSRHTLNDFKAKLAGKLHAEAPKPADSVAATQLIRLTQAASEIGISRRTLARWFADQLEAA